MNEPLTLTWTDKVEALLNKNMDIINEDIWRALGFNNNRTLYRRLKKEGTTIKLIRERILEKKEENLLEIQMEMTKKILDEKKDDSKLTKHLPQHITDAYIEQQLLLTATMLGEDKKEQLAYCGRLIDFLYKRDKFSKRKEQKLLKRV